MVKRRSGELFNCDTAPALTQARLHRLTGVSAESISKLFIKCKLSIQTAMLPRDAVAEVSKNVSLSKFSLSLFVEKQW